MAANPESRKEIDIFESLDESKQFHAPDIRRSEVDEKNRHAFNELTFRSGLCSPTPAERHIDYSTQTAPRHPAKRQGVQEAPAKKQGAPYSRGPHHVNEAAEQHHKHILEKAVQQHECTCTYCTVHPDEEIRHSKHVQRDSRRYDAYADNETHKTHKRTTPIYRREEVVNSTDAAAQDDEEDYNEGSQEDYGRVASLDRRRPARNDDRFNSLRVVKNVRAFVSEWGEKPPMGITENLTLDARYGRVVSPPPPRVTSPVNVAARPKSAVIQGQATHHVQSSAVRHQRKDEPEVHYRSQAVDRTSHQPEQCCCCAHQLLHHQQSLHDHTHKSPQTHQHSHTYDNMQVTPSVRFEAHVVGSHTGTPQYQPPNMEHTDDTEENEAFKLVPVSARRAVYEQMSTPSAGQSKYK